MPGVGGELTTLEGGHTYNYIYGARHRRLRLDYTIAIKQLAFPPEQEKDELLPEQSFFSLNSVLALGLWLTVRRDKW